MFKILKNHKMITFVVLLVIVLFGFQILSKPEIDRNSYVTLVQGSALLNNNPLKIKEKEILKANDIIKTEGNGSLVIIEWGEGSITRLGENTSIKINKNKISNDLSKIEIFFNMLGDSGKTWSNVVSFIGEDSYFKQGFIDTEAAVRGTIFEVNLDKNYLYVEKHEVRLENKKDNKEYIISENRPFDLSKFDFVSVQKFILKLKDNTWEEINKSLDSVYFKELKSAINKSINDFSTLPNLSGTNFSNLSDFEKQIKYKELLSSYQKLKPSLISPEDGKLYKTKLEYQKLLVELAPENDKKNILRTSVYDLKDAIDLKNMDDFKGIVSLLGKNKDYVNFDEFNGFLDNSGLSDSFQESLDGLINNFDVDNIDNIIGDSFDGLKDATLKTVGDLDGNIDKLKGFGDKIKNLGDNFLNK